MSNNQVQLRYVGTFGDEHVIECKGVFTYETFQEKFNEIEAWVLETFGASEVITHTRVSSTPYIMVRNPSIATLMRLRWCI